MGTLNAELLLDRPKLDDAMQPTDQLPTLNRDIACGVKGTMAIVGPLMSYQSMFPYGPEADLKEDPHTKMETVVSP